MVNIVRQNFRKNAKKFNDMNQQLKTKLGDDVLIEHVGSTAIPKMLGKNIVDILVGSHSQLQFFELIKKIVDLGYFMSEKSGNEEYRFFASRKEETQAGDIHIHLALMGTDRYNDFIILKNYLLKNPIIAKTYSNSKKYAVKASNKNRSDYKRIKSIFVSDLLEMARKELQ